MRQHKKLSYELLQHQKPVTTVNTDEKFSSRVVDLSSASITQVKEDVINKGLSYAPKLVIKDKDLENLAINVDAAIPAEKLGGKQRCADIIFKYNDSNDNRSNINEELVLLNLKKKIYEQNLIISKAYKGKYFFFWILR